MTLPRSLITDIPRRKFLELGLKGGFAVVAAPTLLDGLLSGAPMPRPSAGTYDPALLDRVIRKALVRGGEFAEVYIEHRISRNILMEESKFKNAVFGVSRAPASGSSPATRRATRTRTRSPSPRSCAPPRSPPISPAGRRPRCPSTSAPGSGLRISPSRSRSRPWPTRSASRSSGGPTTPPSPTTPRSRWPRSIITTRSAAGPSPTARASFSRTSCPSSSSSSRPSASGTARPTWAASGSAVTPGSRCSTRSRPEDVARTSAREAVAMLERQGRPGRQDGRRHAERLGRRPRPRGRRSPPRGRQHLPGDGRLRRQARPEGRERRLHDGRRRHVAELPRDDEFRRRGHDHEAERPHPGRRPPQVHDRYPVGQADQDGADRERPAGELPLHAHPPDDQHVHREGARTSRPTSWPRRRAGSTSRA